MSRIYKFPLGLAQWQQVRMPQDAQILTIQMQGGKPTLWARVDITRPPETYHIAMVGTGEETNEEVGRYIATVQDGEFVWHFFEHEGNGA